MNAARISECWHHPAAVYRECHHLGDDYVAVWWDSSLSDWLSTYGSIGKRGSITASAATELSHMLALLRGKVAGNGG